MHLRKKILNAFHPLLKPISAWYLSRTRIYKYDNISVRIHPGVFHPGLFFSTKLLLEYLKGQPIQEKHLLELGAGSGLISVVAAKRGARVTGSDINPTAI